MVITDLAHKYSKYQGSTIAEIEELKILSETVDFSMKFDYCISPEIK